MGGIIPNPPCIPLFRLQPPISPRLPVSPSPRLPVSPSPRLLENKGVIKTDLVSPLGRGEIQEKEDTNSRVIHIFWA
jgi:hypothetical protein